MTVLRADRVIRAAFAFRLPADASKEEVLEWVSTFLGHGSMDTNNPLASHDVVAIVEPRLEDTGSEIEEYYIEVDGKAVPQYRLKDIS